MNWCGSVLFSITAVAADNLTDQVLLVVSFARRA